jgi:hypothetical protein
MRKAILPLAIALFAFGAQAAAPVPNTGTAPASAAPAAAQAKPDTGIRVSPSQPAPAAAAGPAAGAPSDSAAARKAKADSIAARAKFIKDSTVSARKIDEIRRLAQKDSLAAVRKKALDSATVRSRYVHDSLVEHHKRVRDSLATRQKFVRDSLASHRKAVMDSLAARLKYVHDSLAAVKAAKDSVAGLAKAAAKAKADSIAGAMNNMALAKAAASKAAAQTRADSIKTARAAKAHQDSLAAAAKRAQADSLRAAAKAKSDSMHAAVRARADSAQAAVRHRADSLKTAAEAKVAAKRAAALARADSIVAAKNARDSLAAAALAAQHEKDSVMAKSYRVLDRPINKDEIKYFLTRFKMKETGKPESTAVNWVYRDKAGAVLTYEPGISEVGYGDEKAPMLDKKDYVPDSLIRFKTDGLLREIMQDKADRYTFANYEITMVQKKSPETKDQVAPAVPAFYIGRYIRKLDDRLVMGDAFQIRLSYGGGGTLEAFSLRDPVLAEAAPAKVVSRQYVADSLARWAKSRTRPREIPYPFHPDRLRIRDIKPVKILETYVLATEKFRDNPQLDGTYLVPSVTVLAQVSLYPAPAKSKEPPPAEPILLHFHFPCRPDAGLCWPDAGRGLDGAGGPSVRAMAPTRNPGATGPNPARNPSSKGAAGAPATKPAP